MRHFVERLTEIITQPSAQQTPTLIPRRESPGLTAARAPLFGKTRKCKAAGALLVLRRIMIPAYAASLCRHVSASPGTRLSEREMRCDSPPRRRTKTCLRFALMPRESSEAPRFRLTVKTVIFLKKKNPTKTKEPRKDPPTSAPFKGSSVHRSGCRLFHRHL